MGLLRRFLMSSIDSDEMNINNYLTIDALEDELTVKMNTTQSVPLSYCIDGSGEWIVLDNDNPPIINTGQCISFKGEYTSGDVGTFVIDKSCNVRGTVMSLIHGDKGGYNNLLYNYCFENLFKDCTTIINAHELKLPSLKLTHNCYYRMFYNCTNLITAPELPATELEGRCYEDMFANTNITEVPYLPASGIGSYCYTGMFENCNSLTHVDCFPSYLYFESYSNYNMNRMFSNCKNLITAVLWNESGNHTIIPNYCFYKMFYECDALQSVTFKNNSNLSTNIIGQYSFAYMFAYCPSLIQGPTIIVNSTALHGACTQMYDSCSSLIDASSLFFNYAEDLYESCYAGMFSRCTSLTKIPILGSQSFYSSACGNGTMRMMFYNCTSLTEVYVNGLFRFGKYTGCLKEMFLNCSNLSKIRILNDNLLRSNNTENWVKGVAHDGEFIIDNCQKHPSPLRGDSGIPAIWNWLVGQQVNQFLSSNITSLSITAEEPILWTGIIRAKATFTGNFILVNGSHSTTAIDFITIRIDENLSSEPIEKEISYTYWGLTATTTVIQQPKPEININLNDQWQLSTTVSNPFEDSYYGVYESFSNKGVRGSAACMYINIKGCYSFDLYIRSSSEYFDGVLVSQLDKDIDKNTSRNNTDLVKTHTIGWDGDTYFDGYQHVLFSNIDGGEHTITVIYQKNDSYSNGGSDQGYVLIPKKQA